MKHTNALINESSPYLLQHAHNPVQWHPWNDNTLETAKIQNKMLLISIGYAACHWCHVMERECFENEEIAAVMNENFICIKVDREERPDIDQIYMDAAHLISGRGGWPLNAFAMPDGRPFYAGTYFPPSGWINVMEQITGLWFTDPMRLERTAGQVTTGMQSMNIIQDMENQDKMTSDDFALMFEKAFETIDMNKGGENRAPKFPMPGFWEWILNYAYKSGDPRALNALTVSLDAMSAGGIYDHVAGGFARYSTDEEWFAPHFEKMLYDNAQLISIFSKAFKHTQNESYQITVKETIDFLLDKFRDASGGFYSSMDADSEGEEGKFYTWTKEEIMDVFKKNENNFRKSEINPANEIENEKSSDIHTNDFCNFFGIISGGNWENGGNILFHQHQNKQERKKYIRHLNLLKQIRETRTPPITDDKILTSWNALLIQGLLDAYSAFGEINYLETAVSVSEFILEIMTDEDGSMKRNFKNGHSGISALLDDYANTIQAFISLFQHTHDIKWLDHAKKQSEYVLEKFSTEENSLLLYAPRDCSNLISRTLERTDNVIPSSNAVMAMNLILLGNILDKDDYRERAGKMIDQVRDNMKENPYFHGHWARAAMLNDLGMRELVITGPDFQDNFLKLSSLYLPDTLFCASGTESELPLLKNRVHKDRNLIYICIDNACGIPYSDFISARVALTTNLN